MFVEQLIVSRKTGGPPGAWNPPVSQTKPIDDAVNTWVDQTGNEIVNITAPSMFMQWMDAERTIRLVVAAVMVTYVPALSPPRPLIEEPNNGSKPYISGWEPVKP